VRTPFRSLLAGVLGLGLISAAQVSPLWEPASPDEVVIDPCDHVSQGREGLSVAWIKVVMLRQGHPASSVCGLWSQLDPVAYRAFEPDWLRLMAQSTARTVVTYGEPTGSLDPDGRWGARSEEAAQTCFAYLSAGDYKAYRLYLERGPAQPCEGI
jgi:hypothetical protein